MHERVDLLLHGLKSENMDTTVFQIAKLIEERVLDSKYLIHVILPLARRANGVIAEFFASLLRQIDASADDERDMMYADLFDTLLQALPVHHPTRHLSVWLECDIYPTSLFVSSLFLCRVLKPKHLFALISTLTYTPNERQLYSLAVLLEAAQDGHVQLPEPLHRRICEIAVKEVLPKQATFTIRSFLAVEAQC